ncbi:hypothetical protein BX600DRAFT_484524 [Xylariales sp. PMI_506]|nr:hypothetical protein BX600DRAFT_484524 [Xylariales sp. PMI_506]
MHLSYKALLAASGSTTALGAAMPALNVTNNLTLFNGTCNADVVTVRKEWRNMAADEKSAYLEAELCLMALPAQTNLSGVTSRFSDLQALHRYKTNTTISGLYVQDIIHNVGQFLPWHRYFMHTHETLLRTECNYTGPMTWWDEAKDADAGALFQSDMWAADAFGGNGTGSDHCVIDGAFANYTVHIGPMLENTDYCFDRDWDTSFLPQIRSESVQNCTQHNDYYRFFNCMVDTDYSPHVNGHSSVGGLMADIDSSPGDPAFFAHHTYIDRLWWQWQQANASARLYAMDGNALNVTYLELAGDVPPAGGWPNTTLDYVLNVYDILPDVEIREVMNAQGGLLCYEYDY